MTALLSVVALAVLVFAATNLDDILLLAAFFADRTLRPRAIIVGQFAGITILTLMSGAAALLALSIPEGWIGLLGLAPLILGIRGLHALWRRQEDEETEGTAHRNSAEAMKHSQWISVALVTVANGGDNLGVYIPLFSRDLSWVPVYAIVFIVLTALWCAAGHWLVNHPLLGARIRQYGHVALPFVLVGLGLLILWDALVLLP